MLAENSGHRVRYEAVTGALFEELIEEGEEIELIGVREAVRQITTAFLSRKQRQEFLAQFDTYVQQSDVSLEILKRVNKELSRQKVQLSVLNSFFDSLISDKTFRPRIDAAVEVKVEARVSAMP